MFFSKMKSEPKQQTISGTHGFSLSCEQELKAIKNSTAFISFTPDGYILDANNLFLNSVGYQLSEIIGKHHRLFCIDSYTDNATYQRFWSALSSGQSSSVTFERRKKDGSLIYLQATYFPVMDDQGKVIKVIKIAADVTEAHYKLQYKDALFDALDKSLAVIEFQPDGTIITANHNFLNLMGYQLPQILSKHHRIFCDESFYKQQPNFWRNLASGTYQSGRFKRFDARGKTIWLEATYNPIKDSSGKVIKVIKFASDISERVNAAFAAVDSAASTSAQTAQITHNAADVLHEAISTSKTIASQVKSASDKGSQLMQQSKNIDEIVTTIRSIADQTNLLALNAAIEAARAGDSGRGFAVVADEVRKLAARTSSATSEITGVVTHNTELIHAIDRELSLITDLALQGEDRINMVATGLEDVGQGVRHFVDLVERLKP